MKKLALFVSLIFILAGCGTTKTYKPTLTDVPAKPVDYPIPLYNENMRIPRPTQLIGRLNIGDTQLTMFGGSMKGVMKTLMQTAHEKGADVVVLTTIKQPEFESAHYRLEANLLRYTDHWETVTMSESNFVAYLQQHKQSVDPIEGIWSDGSPDRIGIIHNTSKPGRDFIAFMLDAQLPSWHAGYKKIDIARADRPGGYSLKYYQDDFAVVKTTIQLNQGNQFGFLVITDDKAGEITLTKISTPMPLNN